RAAHEFERVCLADRVKRDPGNSQVVTGNCQVGGILVPRGAPALATFLQEYLFVHEPNIRRSPNIGNQPWQWRRLEHRAIGWHTARIEQVIVEGGIGCLGELHRQWTWIGEAPLISL